MRTRRKLIAVSRLAAAAAGLYLVAGAGSPETSLAWDDGGSKTATPIEHLVVIFQENVSFDHYFATYPVALNPPGAPFFRAEEDTPSVNGLGTLVKGEPDGVLLTDNPNANNHANDPNAINPFRLDRSQAWGVLFQHCELAWSIRRANPPTLFA
jgi:phospholipase C